jgi:hypothetical protein
MVMLRFALAFGLLSASVAQPTLPAVAKAGPKPAPVAVACDWDISGRWQCGYSTKEECLAALRKLRREHPDVTGCWLSTADPDWWHYGLYVLEYYP